MKTFISWILRHIPRPYLQAIGPAALSVVSLMYWGSAVQCPICARRFRTLLPYGRGRSARKGALCPNCLSLERHRLLYLYLQQETDFFTGKLAVLHIAPERCFSVRFKKLSNLRYTTLDLVSPWADIKADIQQLPMENASYDVVLCNHVLEHIEDDKQAMRELYRVLKVGGWAILQVPIRTDMAETYEDGTIQTAQGRYAAFGQADHFRVYGRDYAARLTEAGFLVQAVTFGSTLPADMVQRYALKDEIIYLGKKADNPH